MENPLCHSIDVNFLKYWLGGVAASAMGSVLSVNAEVKTKIKAIAFDAFPNFDPRPTFALAETLFPDKGKALSTAWRKRQFEYQWLRALSDNTWISGKRQKMD